MLAPKPKAAASTPEAVPAADAVTLLKAATEPNTYPPLPDAMSAPPTAGAPPRHRAGCQQMGRRPPPGNEAR